MRSSTQCIKPLDDKSFESLQLSFSADWSDKDGVPEEA